MKSSIETAPKPGDVVVVHGHKTREGARSGVILEVLGEPGHEHFRSGARAVLALHDFATARVRECAENSESNR